MIAAGRANHAGSGEWEGVATGNSSFIGIEAENDGIGENWPDVQLDAYRRGVAAILAKIGAGAGMCAGHKEYAPKRKIDPTFDMPLFRRAIAEFLQGKTPRAPIAAEDDAGRPTLRRGMRGGAAIETLQALLGLVPDGVFGAGTEAELREKQRQMGLVPDGIAGPATWKALQPNGAGAGTQPPDMPIAPGPRPAPAPVAPALAAVARVPEPESPGRLPRTDGRRALAPDGSSFAGVYREGFFSLGSTTIAGWLDGLATPPPISASRLRVLKAMSVNEGRLEAINTYDTAFVSFGILQWTAGQAGEPGELAYLLDTVKRADPAAFDDCFGQYGLDVSTVGFTGRLVLEGRTLTTVADKQVFRDVVWAYRFWRAGHVDAVRAAQIEVAAARIDRFRSAPVAGHPLETWMTSERGMAHLLDQHVNRPGHVPQTLADAVAGVYGAVVPDPATLDEAAEARLIDAYLELRNATSMTDSDRRAARIDAAVGHGTLSAGRHSFS